MRVKYGKCVGCGRRGIISWRKKSNEADPKGFKLTDMGKGIYACNLDCYKKVGEVIVKNTKDIMKILP